jgi:DNA-binding SARP family transcriptional activator
LADESLEGNLEEARRILLEALELQTARRHDHYRGISHLNLAYTLLAAARMPEALAHSDQSLALLSRTSAGTEMPTVLVARAWSLLHQGRQSEGHIALATAKETMGPERSVTLLECADLESSYGDPLAAGALLSEAAALGVPRYAEDYGAVLLAELESRDGRHDEAARLIEGMDHSVPRTMAAFLGRLHLVEARVRIRAGLDPQVALVEASEIFRRQSALLWMPCVEVLRASMELDITALNARFGQVFDKGAIYATFCADDIAPRLGDLTGTVADVVAEQARTWPRRWRPILRRTMAGRTQTSAIAAAQLLDELGERSDISRLRLFSRMMRTPSTAGLGRGLARRLAPLAVVRDLGHASIEVGDRYVDGSSMRRKVLTLVCFLITKPSFAATRDQVLEALWPDLDPRVAVNSLNQTVYFLRRVFEEGYREDESANYVHHDGEVVRLDPALVSSDTSSCRAMIDTIHETWDPGSIANLSRSYAGRFAMDFEYEDWASPFRETLHAAYLGVIEHAIRLDAKAGLYERASSLARRTIEVDPEAEAFESALVRLYRSTGLHAAAAEQGSHYATLDASAR